MENAIKVGATYLTTTDWAYFDLNNHNNVVLDAGIKFEVTKVDKKYIYVRFLNGKCKGEHRCIENADYIVRTFKQINMFTQGDNVMLFHSDLDMPLGTEFTFVSMLETPLTYKGVELDCVVLDKNGNPTLGKAANLKKCKPMRKRVKFEGDNGDEDTVIHLVKRTGNKITVITTDPKDGLLYLGEARCNPSDKFDMSFGIKLAAARAINDIETIKEMLDED